MTYPDLLATSDQYTLQGHIGQFTICSYRGGLVEVISKDTGEISLHNRDLFSKIVVGKVDTGIEEAGL